MSLVCYNTYMSIGPNKKEEASFKPSVVDKTIYNTKTILNGFFSNPVHYIFWITASGIIIGLFLGISFSWQLYLITGFFGIIKFYEQYKKVN